MSSTAENMAPDTAFTRKSRVKVSLFEEHGAMVLGDHMEVLRQGTVGDEARPLLYADHMPRAIKVRSQKTRIKNLVQVQDSRRGSGACQSDTECADVNEEQVQKNDGD